jgi:hypothetical protein
MMRGKHLPFRRFAAALAAFLLSWSIGSVAAEQKPVPQEQRIAFVSVAGAPGDGERALSAALVKRLSAAGVKGVMQFTQGAYSVEGIVKVGEAARGRQNVRIDWTVFAPDGTTLGGVVQTRIVRRGSLDRRWGPAADAAARAATNEILALLRP